MDITLQTTLATVIQQLASFMGTTVETIQANAPYWLALYGRYHLISNLGMYLISGAFIAVLVGICGLLLLGILLEIDVVSAEVLTKHWKLFFIIGLIVLLSQTIIAIVQYCISPELFGLQALIKMIK